MLSGIIIAKNEQENLSKAVKSLNFAQEIVVVDNGSTDKSLDIARRLKAKIVDGSKIHDDFAKLRNLGMSLAKGNWILFLDVDEEIPASLAREIQKAMTADNFQAFKIRRHDFFLGKKLSHGEIAEAYNQGFIRLVKKGSGEWQGLVHERFVTKGQTGLLNNRIIHRPHQTVTEFISKVNFYSGLRAKELKKENKQTNIFEIVFYPFLKFFYTYFFRLGFLDGKEGFIYSFMMSFHSFLSRSKLYTS